MSTIAKLRDSAVPYLLCIATIVVFSGTVQTASAQEYASKQRARVAVGYYARARAMLVEALAEFEQGRKTAQPDMLLDSEEWRLSLISLTEQLNRLVDPKPKVTLEGARFTANPRMIKREHDRLPPVADGAKDSNTYGERDRMRTKQAARAKMYEPKKPTQTEAAEEEESEAAEEESVEAALPPTKGEAAKAPASTAAKTEAGKAEAGEEEAEEAAPVEQTKGAKDDALAGGSASQEEEGKELSEDEKMTAAIEQAVRQRLETLKAEEQGEGSEPALTGPAAKQAAEPTASAAANDSEEEEE